MSQWGAGSFRTTCLNPATPISRDRRRFPCGLPSHVGRVSDRSEGIGGEVSSNSSRDWRTGRYLIKDAETGYHARGNQKMLSLKRTTSGADRTLSTGKVRSGVRDT